jgi:crotonobetainyl-CoA:carnitine CoA-transferase CaiB-like acyl-CoA transferase
LRVLDLTQFILGPLAAQILGDMGADVIKVESPGGDANRYIGESRHEGMAAMFLGVNRNKRSVVLNLKQPAAMATLLQMVDHADVFLHSMRTDAAQRLGIDYASISARNPRIVYACAPGYRSDGPLRNRPAYDDVIQGESGIADICFRATGEHAYMPTVLADKFCGYVLASAIGMALFHRERTGEGQSVEAPMLETMLGFNLVDHLCSGALDEPMGPLGYGRALNPQRRPYATKDGCVCALATTDGQWQRVFAAFGRSDLAQDSRFATVASRAANNNALYGALGDEIARHTTAEAQARLDSADVPNAPVRRLSDMPTDPYLVETGFFHHYRHPKAGAFVTPSITTRFSKSPGQLRRPPPCLGEHTDEVLAELGIHRAEAA